MKTTVTLSRQKCLIVMTFLVVLVPAISAQPVLDEYVREGLKSNLLLQQKNLSLKQAQASFQIARSHFLPSVNLLADYTSGKGGRSISIPVGDLLNPVYASLNQLTQSDEFPQVANVEQNFFPNNFYDVKVRTSLPIFNTDLYLNQTIRGHQLMMEQYELDIYKRQLVQEIKTAYYQYLSAIAEVKIYESASVLVHKNLEVNESLFRNGKSLPANVLRSKSEVEQIKAELNSARNQTDNARKYFNFLLNKDLNSDIAVAIPATETLQPDTLPTGAEHREELNLLKTLREINEASARMSQLSRLPKVNAFLDLGSQAEDWAFNSDARYYLVGVQLSMPLFTGFRSTLTTRQQKLETQRTELNLRNTSRQLQMTADVARHAVNTAIQNFSASREQLRSAQSYFNLVEKGYQEGVNSLIEFLDARNQLTTSQLQQNLRLFEMLTALARFERETAAYEFE